MLITRVPRITQCLFTTTLAVRMSDINYGNHLGHDALVSLLHEARVRFLRHLGYTELNVEGLGMLVTNLVVNYLHEAFHADPLLIRLGVAETSQTRVAFLYEVQHATSQQDIARACTTLAFYDPTLKKVAPMPEKFASALGGAQG